jgi:hypothetical protein
MTDEVIPHFHNDLGVQVIEIGKKFMCMDAAAAVVVIDRKQAALLSAPAATNHQPG